MSDEKRHFQVEIAASPQDIWEAIINPEQTPAYYYGTAFTDSELRAGGSYSYKDGHRSSPGSRPSWNPANRQTTVGWSGHT